jgi:dienelactone hydrolase
VCIETDNVSLTGDLRLPQDLRGVVVFAHGGGSSRLSPRNRHVAEKLNVFGLATVLLDLLTPEEENRDRITRQLRFDTKLLRRRVDAAVEWAASDQATRGVHIGCFGASTGAAGALLAAVDNPGLISAVVSRGGRPDLAAKELPSVTSATLLIVGGEDPEVIELNRRAIKRMTSEKRLEIIPGASHLFEEPGKLDEVARLAGEWFVTHMAG